MASPLCLALGQYFDDNGDPLAGGKIYSYIAGTSTPLATYSDPEGQVANINPLELDAAGRGTVYLGNGTYKIRITDANDVDILVLDDVAPFSESALDVGEWSPWARHAVTDGQLAGDLAGETLNLALYRAAIYDCVITRGTTVVACGRVHIENVNDVARVNVSLFSVNHGVTFTVDQTLLVATLQAALSTGPGDGNIKLSRRLVPI
jgi:hypothetical protein